MQTNTSTSAPPALRMPHIWPITIMAIPLHLDLVEAPVPKHLYLPTQAMPLFRSAPSASAHQVRTLAQFSTSAAVQLPCSCLSARPASVLAPPPTACCATTARCHKLKPTTAAHGMR